MNWMKWLATGLFALAIACGSEKTNDSPIDVLGNDTEEPDLNPDVSAQALYTEEQLEQIEDFEEARKRFEEMSLDEYKQTYGPQADYLDAMPYNPNDATNMDAIKERISLTPEQYTTYETLGFTVLGNETHNTFFSALIDLYSSDLPLYFSVDAMLDTLHLSFDRILMDLEVFILADALADMLDKMGEQLSKISEPADPEIAKSLDDAAVFLCVADSLLQDSKQPCARSVDKETKAYLSLIAAEAPAEVPIFGKLVTEDFSQFKPRGHYTKREELKRYFRAMMWIQRIGLDFSKYSRHTRLAYLLSELLSKSGGQAQYDRINKTIELLVGISDSMNAPLLKAIADDIEVNSIEDLSRPEVVEKLVQAALKQGAGAQRINSTFLDADPTLASGEFTPIPPAFHFMGQRFIVDSYVFNNVTYDRVKEPKERYMASPLDVWAVLGNREAVDLLEDELDSYQYQANLATLDYLLTTYESEFWGENFYNAWLAALMTLDEDTTGDSYPPVMKTKTWQHRVLSAQLGSWAHLRHDTLLYAKPSYDMTGCEYPDAWVDPYPAFFEKLADVALLAKEGLGALGILEMNVSKPEVEPGEWDPEAEWFEGREVATYYTRLAEISLMLADIAKAELAGEPLSEPQLGFMNDLIFEGGGSGEPPFTGWYVQLLYKYNELTDDDFDPTIADVHTSTNTRQVLHVGTGYPNLMLISVETDCQIRAYVGPVLSYHEKIEENYSRLDDETWKGMLEAGQESRPSWAETFVK